MSFELTQYVGIVKEYTDKYSQIDKEMFFLSFINMYKNKNISVSLQELGIGEEIYLAVLDLPIIEINKLSIDDFEKLLDTITNGSNIYKGYVSDKKNEELDDLISNIKNSNESQKIFDILNVINNSIHRIFLVRKKDDFYICQLKSQWSTYSIYRIHIKQYVSFYREQKIKSFFEED